LISEVCRGKYLLEKHHDIDLDSEKVDPEGHIPKAYSTWKAKFEQLEGAE
jgi:hypothetical protein